MNKTQALIQQVLFSTQDSQGREVTSSVTRAIQIARILDEHKLLATVTAGDLLAKLKEAIEEHIPDSGFFQWYVDEYSIDCEAEHFWSVVEEALKKAFE